MSDPPDPFAALGLPPGPDLTDEQVRAAWRAIATATHPDRPARNLINFRHRVLPPPAPAARVTVSPWRALLLVPARIRHGQPGRLALRVLAAAVLTLLVLRSGAGTPPIARLLTGIATWLILTSRGDLAPPPGR